MSVSDLSILPPVSGHNAQHYALEPEPTPADPEPLTRSPQRRRRNFQACLTELEKPRLIKKQGRSRVATGHVSLDDTSESNKSDETKEKYDHCISELAKARERRAKREAEKSKYNNCLNEIKSISDGGADTAVRRSSKEKKPPKRQPSDSKRKSTVSRLGASLSKLSFTGGGDPEKRSNMVEA